ncbi:hypothetical protein BHM03_00032915 [Ensete ventricosum]|uniref:SPX domain-containing protein n=1 Tax=Ensete ventricosum TaxID=4639 RepID=A0A426Z9C7_ENSVE|nr:hypothetical protein B296_00010515 [Ensete ventricosum]RZS02807.1 hypothetical protein BHM03_00032915 [Ensete ventricosum]
MARDPEAAFFKRLEGLQPCEVSELKPGTHIFAVYEKLKEIESTILAKRDALRQFEIEYRKALAHFQEVTNKYNQEKQSVSTFEK